MVVYFDDIPVFIRTQEEHLLHLIQVLETRGICQFKEACIHILIRPLLRFVVFSEGVANPDKVKIISEWLLKV